jgi:hypothetical protein
MGRLIGRCRLQLSWTRYSGLKRHDTARALVWAGCGEIAGDDEEDGFVIVKNFLGDFEAVLLPSSVMAVSAMRSVSLWRLVCLLYYNKIKYVKQGHSNTGSHAKDVHDVHNVHKIKKHISYVTANY